MKGKISIFYCLVISLIITGCGSGHSSGATATSRAPSTATATPTGTPAPLPTLTPTLSPTAIPWALISDGLKIETICLEISQSYADPTDPKFSLPIDEPIEQYLSRAGLEVLNPGASCAGALSFSLMGEPLGAEYTGLLAPCYTGASVKATTTFSVPGMSQHIASSESKIKTTLTTSVCPNPEEAPYRWEHLFVQNLGNIWGPGYLYHVIETSTDERITGYASAALVYLEPEFQPILVRDLNHPNEIIRGEIGAAIDTLFWESEPGSSALQWAVVPPAISPESMEAARATQRTLILLLTDNNVSVRAAVARLLGTIGPDAKEAIPALMEALLLEEDRLEAAARENCSSPCSSDFFLKDSFFRAGVWAVGQMDSQDVVPMLIDLLRRQDEPAFRNLAHSNQRPYVIRDALRAITGQDFGVDANQWQTWWETRK